MACSLMIHMHHQRAYANALTSALNGGTMESLLRDYTPL